MSLVGYDASSSEEDDSNENCSDPVNNELKSASEKDARKKFLPEKLLDTASQKSGKIGIQIRAPEIPQIDSDSDDDSGPSKKAKTAPAESKPRSGLFAKLPAPVNAPATGRKSKTEVPLYQFKSDKKLPKKESVTEAKEKTDTKNFKDSKTISAVPSISEIRKRSKAAAAKLIMNQNTSKEEGNDDEDDEEPPTPSGFFSYVDKLDEKQIAEVQLPEIEPLKNPAMAMELAPDVEYTPNHVNPQATLGWESQVPYANSIPPPQSSWDSNITENAQEMIRLQGKRNRNEEMNFIDFHEEDALRGGKEMLLKTISEEKGLDRTKVNVPGGMMKKKHQLPYLIQQAKARELELKNTWAQNRQTRQQTQSKYGW